MASDARASGVPRLLALALALILLLPTLHGGLGASGTLRPLGAGVQREDSLGSDEHLRVVAPARQERSETRSWATNGSLDWPQVQRDPQRTGYVTETLGTIFQVAWTRPFQPEKVYPQVQAIVYQGKVYVGTEMGNMYALNAQAGNQEWVYPVGAPILNSVAAGNGQVFFGAMDGSVYAFDAATGDLVWKSPLSWRLGFSTAPVLADGKVMLGGRNGIFYALDPDTGTTLWQYDVGSPILQTAAWNDGRVFFGAMDMHVYALNSSNGSLAWQSQRLPGMAFKDYWPVVYQGKVMIQPMGRGGIEAGFPFVDIWYGDFDWDWYMAHGPTVAAGRLTDIPEAMAAQDAVLADYQAHPDEYTAILIILDETSGGEAYVVPHWTTQTMHGAVTPPCVDRDGMLIVPTLFIRSGWARLDLGMRRIVDILYDHRNSSGGAMERGDIPAGFGNFDENINVSCTANLVLGMHTQEGNANYTGAFDLDTRRWIPIGGYHANGQMSTNTQGGGGNPASISNGIVYHISFHELIARAAN